MIHGIYAILNINRKAIYIGQSKNVRKRIINHKALLRNNNHYSQELQNNWNADGEKAFIFITLESIDNYDKDELLKKEADWIEYHKGNTEFSVYNIFDGYRMAESTRYKLRMANLGDNNPKYWLGKQRSEATKKKQAETMKGKMAGENHPMWGKVGYWKGKAKSAEYRRKISEGLKGHFVSEETRKKISESGKGAQGYGKVIPDDEMINDIMNGITQNGFVAKYNKSVNTLKRIKRELRENGKMSKDYINKKVEPSQEMIDDILSGITQKAFVNKYNKNVGVLKRIKKELI